MIYLVDDKKLRQEKDYNWSSKRFQQYDEFIRPIYTLSELQDKNKEVFQEGNVILYHESFVDKTYIKSEAAERRQHLQEFIKKKNSYLVLFSGSKNTRDLTEGVANIPVSVLYSNLESFIKKYSTGDLNLRYLLFGDNPEIEEEISIKLDSELFKTTQEQIYTSTKKNLFIRPDEKYINQPLDNYVEKIFFDNVTDKDLSDAINQWMNEDVYENIFVPLCFGSTLSDYNGLRLASHIRCTKSKNQTSRIYIYGFVGIDYLLQNDYFNILKTKNTFLIPFTKLAIFESIQKSQLILLSEELPFEIVKLKLEVPQNYEDNHSISNEWAIYRWAMTINSEDDAIEKITQKIDSNLYFKYLKTIYPIAESKKLIDDDIKIHTIGTPKILLIDDEAEKGWYEIFCKIFSDVNKLAFDSLGDDFKNQTEEQIIECCLEKVVNYDADIVILDFRLHQNDFNDKDIAEVTGIKILKEIKKYNPGIQVIIFSATNKVWNLQALQDAGADGFIVKESPENSINPNLTKDSIMYFRSAIEKVIRKKFLKKFFITCETIQQQLYDCDTEPETSFDDFIKDLKSHIKLIKYSANKIDLETSMTLDVVFLNCYNFMEKFKQHYLREIDYCQLLGIDEIEMKRYTWLNGTITNQGKFIRNGVNDSPSWFNTMAGLFIDYFQIANIEDQAIGKLNLIKSKRNDYIHGAKSKFDQSELLMAISLCEMITSNLRE